MLIWKDKEATAAALLTLIIISRCFIFVCFLTPFNSIVLFSLNIFLWLNLWLQFLFTPLLLLWCSSYTLSTFSLFNNDILCFNLMTGPFNTYDRQLLFSFWTRLSCTIFYAFGILNFLTCYLSWYFELLKWSFRKRFIW